MGYSIYGKGYILDMSEVEFNCPHCEYHYTSEWYEKQLLKSIKGFIYKTCKICKKKIGISSDIMGDVVVWLKENENKTQKNENTSNAENK